MDISSLWLVFLLNISRKALLGTCFCSSLTHTQPHSSHAMAASPAFYFLINHGKKNYRTSDCSAGSITQHQLHPLYNSPLGIHPEREPFLLGERICSSLCIIDSLISFPFLPEHLLYPRTMPHVRETVAKQTDQFLLSWSLQNHQPKNCRGGAGGGCCGECSGRECQRASIKVWRARRKTRPGDEKRELQARPQEKHVQSAGGKKLIFEKINQADKTGKTDQVKRGQGEHCKYYYGWRHRTIDRTSC